MQPPDYGLHETDATAEVFSSSILPLNCFWVIRRLNSQGPLNPWVSKGNSQPSTNFFINSLEVQDVDYLLNSKQFLDKDHWTEVK
jgi:hypothetical protein